MGDEIQLAVMAAITEVFKPQNSSSLSGIIKQPDFEFSEFSASSLKKVELCMHIEESLGVEMEPHHLQENPTFLCFVEWLRQQTQAS